MTISTSDLIRSALPPPGTDKLADVFREKLRLGEIKYGRPVTPDDGRPVGVDQLQELIDAQIYGVNDQRKEGLHDDLIGEQFIHDTLKPYSLDDPLHESLSDLFADVIAAHPVAVLAGAEPMPDARAQRIAELEAENRTLRHALACLWSEVEDVTPISLATEMKVEAALKGRAQG